MTREDERSNLTPEQHRRVQEWIDAGLLKAHVVLAVDPVTGQEQVVRGEEFLKLIAASGIQSPAVVVRIYIASNDDEGFHLLLAACASFPAPSVPGGMERR